MLLTVFNHSKNIDVNMWCLLISTPLKCTLEITQFDMCVT